MLQLERSEKILNYLESHHAATIKQIAADIHMSETVVRRGLAVLEKQHIVRRSYGFATLLKYRSNTLPLSLRIQDNRKEKSIIAQKAVSLLEAGDTVFLDESSTTGQFASLIDPALDLTVITNSLMTANILAEKRIKTYCTGGLLLFDTLSFTGKYADPLLQTIYADKCFFSSSGITESGLICDKMIENSSSKRLMIDHSEQKIFLCDHTKFNGGYPYVIASVTEIDCLVSDALPPDSLAEKIKRII